MNDDRHSQSNNPYRPKVLKTHDRLHDAQLLRDVAIINAQTISELGALPPGGLPAKLKRKPNLPHRTTSIAPMTMAVHHPKDEPMNLHQIAAATMLPLAVAACSSHGDPMNPKQNPHPAKRYEVIATADAPGPWDSVNGYISYEVVNPECTPEDKFLGVHALPQDVGHSIEMSRVDGKTWKGFFYRDFMQDEDYYGLGVCRWTATSATASFIVHGVRFNSGSTIEEFLKNGPQTDYFRKNFYEDKSNPLDSIPGLSAVNPLVTHQPEAFFPITVTVKEATP